MVVSQLMEEIIIEESRVIATEQLEIGMQYVKVAVGDTDGTQTTEHDNSSNIYIATLQRELSCAKLTIERLTQQLNDHLPPFCEQSFVTDKYTKFHTGLPNFKVVKAIFDHVSKGLPTKRVAKLSNFQEFMCLMLKLRTNIPDEGSAYQFGVSQATISRIILKWLKLADTRLAGLIHWPDHDALQKAMPECFKVSFGKKVAVIIDCFEVFIE